MHLAYYVVCTNLYLFNWYVIDAVYLLSLWPLSLNLNAIVYLNITYTFKLEL